MGNVSYITREGLEKIKKELDYLMNVERPAISRLIGDAVDKGDLNENAEFAAAKEAQGMLEMKISQLENIVANARIIDGANLNDSEIRLLNKIRIRKNGKIGINTPVAQGLLGKRTGDVVNISVPSGEIALEILNISI